MPAGASRPQPRAVLRSATLDEAPGSNTLLDEIQRCWASPPICTSVVIVFWQRYLCKVAAATGQTEVELILKLMPLKADRTLPGELMAGIRQCGWSIMTVPAGSRKPEVFKHSLPSRGPLTVIKAAGEVPKHPVSTLRGGVRMKNQLLRGSHPGAKSRSTSATPATSCSAPVTPTIQHRTLESPKLFSFVPPESAKVSSFAPPKAAPIVSPEETILEGRPRTKTRNSMHRSDRTCC